MAATCCVTFLLALLMIHASSVVVPRVKLNDGRDMPAIGLGTYLGFDLKKMASILPNETASVAFQRSVEVGWRLFDTASIYKTEKAIGEAIKTKIEDGTIKRDDVFVTTKVWNTHHKREQVAEALRESLKQLGLNYVDLYLIHWPIGLNEDYSTSKIDYMETWRGLEDMKKLGLAKSIGVSNFNEDQLKRVIEEGTVKPAVLQIEVHPVFPQKELVSFAQSEDILVMAYSPFGYFTWKERGQEAKDSDDIEAIAKKYGKTAAQVILRWHIDRHIVPIPKTITIERLRENINVFDFQLDDAEIEKINSYDMKSRFTLPSFWQDHPYYPFEKVEDPAPDPFKKV